MSDHTPGPWKADITMFDARVVTDENPKNNLVICVMPGWMPKFSDEEHANARLIAAAPDLYACCKDFVEKVESGRARSKDSYAKMKAALSRIE